MSKPTEEDAKKLYDEVQKAYDSTIQNRINEEVKERKWGRS